MNRHQGLQGSGRIAHRDIDVLLPTQAEKNALRGASLTTLCFGDPNSNGAWRITVDGDNLVIQRRESGAWVTKEDFTP